MMEGKTGSQPTLNYKGGGHLTQATFRDGPLCDCVTQSLTRYFKDMNGQRPDHLYDMVIGEIERPLLAIVMEECDQNQSRAAQVLGINRNTLRKKLKTHGFV